MTNIINRGASDLFPPLLENFLNAPLGRQMGSLMRAPEADVIETEDQIRVIVEMPGMDANEIEIGLENNVLTINGEKQEERTEERSTWHLSERRYGKFSRSFLLPRDVDHDRIDARFENGVLKIAIPKSERARRRRIEIRGDGSQRVGMGNNRNQQEQKQQ